MLLPDLGTRTAFISALRAAGVASVFHYVPLHSAPAGVRFGRTCGELPVTDAAGEQLVRLPLWPGVQAHADAIIRAVFDAAHATAPAHAANGPLSVSGAK